MPFADLYPTLLSFLADDLPELATAACQILYRFCGTASFRQYITQQDNVITPLFAILQNRQKTQVYPITLQLLIQLTRDVKGRAALEAVDYISPLQKLIAADLALAETAELCIHLCGIPHLLNAFQRSQVPLTALQAVQKWLTKPTAAPATAKGVAPLPPASSYNGQTNSLIMLLKLIECFIPEAARLAPTAEEQLVFADALLQQACDQWMSLLPEMERGCDLQLQLLHTLSILLLTTKGKLGCSTSNVVKMTVSWLQTLTSAPADNTDAHWQLPQSLEKHSTLIAALLYLVAAAAECPTMRAELLQTTTLTMLSQIMELGTFTAPQQKVVAMAALALSRLFLESHARTDFIGTSSNPFGILLKHIDPLHEHTRPQLSPATIRNVSLCLSTLIVTYQHACVFDKVAGFEILLALRHQPHTQDYIQTLNACLKRIVQYNPAVAWRFTDRIGSHSLTVQTNGATAVVPMIWTSRLTVEDQTQMPQLLKLASETSVDCATKPVILVDPDADSKLHETLAVAARIAAEHSWKCRTAKVRDDLGDFVKRQNKSRPDDSVGSLDDDKASIKSYKVGNKEEKTGAVGKGKRTDSVGSTASTVVSPNQKEGGNAQASERRSSLVSSNHATAKFETEESTGHMYLPSQVISSSMLRAMIKTLAKCVAATLPLTPTTEAVKETLFASGPLHRRRSSVPFEARLRELANQQKSAVLPIGALMNHGLGTVPLRALLFKACCDRIGLPCSVERNGYGHGWNTVTFLELYPEKATKSSSRFVPPGTKSRSSTIQPGRYLVKLKDEVGDLIYEKSYMQWYQYTHV